MVTTPATGRKLPRNSPLAAKALQPGGINDIGFAAGHILGLARIDEDDVKAVLFQHFVGWNPVNTGGFHRHAGDPACLEPAGHLMQVAGERAKRVARNYRLPAN